MRKRTGLSLLAVFLLLCALGSTVYLRQKAPPETARLLPESDAIVYLNLKPVRAAMHFDQQPVQPSPSYRLFINATGIVVERDLDSAALAIHRMADPSGPNGTVAFSEVFQGRFDSARLTRYLAAQSSAQESYANHTIYAIPSEGRTLRVAILGYDMVAGSNMPTPEQIHSILDRQRAAASPFAGSSLLNALYKEVPAFSTAWAIGQVGLPFSEHGKIAVADMELPLTANTTLVGSVGVSGLHPGSVAVRVDQLAPDEAAAARSVQSLSGLLSFVRAVQPPGQTPSEMAAKEIVDSIKIEQHRDRASLTAVVPQQALRNLNPSR